MRRFRASMYAFAATIPVLLTGIALARQAAAQPVDIVFMKAVIHIMDEANPTAQPVAITGDTIIYAEPSILAGAPADLDVGPYRQE